MKHTVVIALLLTIVVASASWATTTHQTFTLYNDPSGSVNMMGWITARGDLTSSGWTYTGGPSESGIVFSQLAEGGCPSPPGALYIKHSDGSSKITQSWVGTDEYVGVKASDITRLTYYTYTTIRGWGSVGTNPCKNHDWDHMVRQPVQLQISFKKSPDSSEYVHLMFRPWGLTGVPSFYDFEAWQYWDCLAPSAVWWDGLPDNGGESEGSYGNWDYFFNPSIGKYPDAVIAAPCDTSYYGKWGDNECAVPEPYPYRTGSGKSLNLVVGARAFSVNYPGASGVAWWQESCNFEGYADNLTIGVQDQDYNVTETTWDFERYEPGYAWVGGVYGIKNADKNLSDYGFSNWRYRHKFAMWGKVLDVASYSEFTMDDGSGSPVLVIASGGDAYVLPGHYVRVEGAVSKRRTPCPQYQIGYYFTAEPEAVWVLGGPF